MYTPLRLKFSKYKFALRMTMPGINLYLSHLL